MLKCYVYQSIYRATQLLRAEVRVGIAVLLLHGVICALVADAEEQLTQLYNWNSWQ